MKKSGKVTGLLRDNKVILIDGNPYSYGDVESFTRYLKVEDKVTYEVAPGGMALSYVRKEQTQSQPVSSGGRTQTTSYKEDPEKSRQIRFLACHERAVQLVSATLDKDTNLDTMDDQQIIIKAVHDISRLLYQDTCLALGIDYDLKG